MPGRFRGLDGWAGLAVFLGFVFHFRGVSLSTDEGYTAWLVCHTSLDEMWKALVAGDSSELQMLGYNLYLWSWVHLFGWGEYSLRAANLPFAALMAGALGLTSRLALGRRFAWLTVAASPFLLLYLNVSRAYFAMAALTAVSTGALLVYAYGPAEVRRRSAWVCFSFLAMAIPFHMMALLVGPAFAAIVLAEARNEPRRWWADWRGPVLAFAPVFVAIGAFLVWTFSLPQEYEYGPPSALQFGWSLYKLAGFWPLGPSGSVIRTAEGSGLWAPFVGPLAVGLAATGYAVVGRLTRVSGTLLAAFGAAFGCAYLASLAVGTNLVARHLIGLLPLLLFFVVARLRTAGRAAALGLVWLLADARQIGLEQYGEDDYRRAVGFTIEEARRTGGRIAFVGDPHASAYYGLRLRDGLNVPWPVEATGLFGMDVSTERAAEYLQSCRREGRPLILGLGYGRRLIPQKGQPAEGSGWIPLIGGRAPSASFRFFRIYVLR